MIKDIDLKVEIKYCNSKNINSITEIEKLDSLPVVLIDDIIYCKNRFLTIDELSKILDMGFSLQADNE